MQPATLLAANGNACLQVLTGILDRVGPELGPLLEVTLGSESGLQSFNFLGGSLLAEVDHVVAENLPGKPQASWPLNSGFAGSSPGHAGS